MIRRTIVLEPQEEGGYTVYVPSLRGCISQGETLEKAFDNIKEAIELYMEEELTKAKNIIKVLERNVYQAIWYSSFYERVTLEGVADDICNAFGKSYESHGITVCQEALLDALTLAVTRIIYGEGENTSSLEALCAILKKNEVREQLTEKKQKQVEDLIKRVNKIKGDQKCDKLKSYRNTQLAHLATENRKKHKKAEYGNAPDILEQILSVVNDFKVAIEDVQLDFEFLRSRSREFANEFWRYAAHLKNQKG